MRSWLAGSLGVLILMCVAAPAAAAPVTIGVFDYSPDNGWFELFDVSPLLDASGGLIPNLVDPQVELNGDPTMVYDLALDAAQTTLIPGTSATTTPLDLAALNVTSAVLLLGGVTPAGVLTTTYFNADSIPIAAWSGVTDFAIIEYTPAPVPEPGTLALLSSGLVAFWGARRRRTDVS